MRLRLRLPSRQRARERRPRVQDSALWHGALLEISWLTGRVHQLEQQLLDNGLIPDANPRTGPTEDTWIDERRST